MKTTKIVIKNLFGIAEQELDGQSVELTGGNGAGKTSVIDAVKYALTNKSDRDYIVRAGANEGEILIETNTGLSINRKKRANGKSDYKSIRVGKDEIKQPESFLSTLFTPLQLNPVEFAGMSRQEQNRAILDLIQYDWDMETIRGWFGEIPQGINYEQNILQVLNDIQADSGEYFQSRQNVNRDIRNKQAFIEDIKKDIPAGYDVELWEGYDLSAKYSELMSTQQRNAEIEKAQDFLDNSNNKIRGYEAERDIAISSAEKAISSERESLLADIARMESAIAVAKEKLNGLNGKLESQIAMAQSEYNSNLSRLGKSMNNAEEWASLEMKSTDALQAEITHAEDMKKHINEFKRMQEMQADVENLTQVSAAYTKKIELARELPGQILQTATLPIEGLTVENGIPLINGLPISNLSEGEQLALCVDVAAANPNALSLILLDGTEKLSEENRNKLYAKCKARGLQFIATRTTNDNELMITTL